MAQCRRQLKKVTNHDDYRRQIGDKLSLDEAKLFRLVKSATTEEVRNFLQGHPNLNKDKVNESCHTILQEAVCRRDAAMVEVLLGSGSDLGPALELAAQIGAHDVLDVLLNACSTENYVEKDTEDSIEDGSNVKNTEDTRFSSEDNTNFHRRLCENKSISGDLAAEPIPEESSDSSEEDYAYDYFDVEAIKERPAQIIDFNISRTITECHRPKGNASSTPKLKRSRKWSLPKVFGRSLCLTRSTTPTTKPSPDSLVSKMAANEQYEFGENPLFKCATSSFSSPVSSSVPSGKGRKKSVSSQPLILAAAADDYEGTALLIKMGCHIQEPHEPTCMCLVCKKIRSDHHDLLHDAHNRLMKYRALTSASYIILTSPDPILTSLKRSDLLATLAALYPENKDEFEQLSRRCSTLAVELLTNCTSEKEVVQLLMRECGLKENGIFTYGRLQLAVGLEQKEFVTNSTCQHALYSLWLGPRKSWLQWSTRRKLFHVIVHLILAPIICTAYVLVTILPSTAAKAHVSTDLPEETEIPKKSISFRCREDPVSILTSKVMVPLNRFIYAASTYCLFLAVLLYSIVQHREEESHPAVGLAWYHWLLSAWVMAHFYKIAQDLYTERFLSYWTSWWTLFELIMMLLFTIASCCFVVARLHKIDEKTWRLALVAEGLFPIATTLSFMRVLQWMHLSQNLGPVIISFSRMTTVIGRLFIVFLIVLLSFSTGLYAVYQNFRLVGNATSEDNEEHKGLFISYTRTLQALFWAIFGHGEDNYAGVPEGYVWHMAISNASESFLDDPNDSFPVIVGYSLWGLFHVAFVIVLLNMLIAVMTNCFQVIHDNFDVEWKFARTKLWMYYLEDHNAVPPPFNLLLPVTGLIALLARQMNMLKRKKPTGTHSSKSETVADGKKIERCVKATAATNNLMTAKPRGKECEDDDEYTKTITTLVERFVLKRNHQEVMKSTE